MIDHRHYEVNARRLFFFACAAGWSVCAAVFSFAAEAWLYAGLHVIAAILTSLAATFYLGRLTPKFAWNEAAFTRKHA